MTQLTLEQVALTVFPTCINILEQSEYEYDSGKRVLKDSSKMAFNFAEAFIAERDRRLNNG